MAYARELRKNEFEQFDIQSDFIQDLAYEIRERVMVGYTEEVYDAILGFGWSANIWDRAIDIIHFSEAGIQIYDSNE